MPSDWRQDDAPLTPRLVEPLLDRSLDHVGGACAEHTAARSTSRWEYRPEEGGRFDLLLQPRVHGLHTGAVLHVGEVFEVDCVHNGVDLILYLHLADGRGWACDFLPDIGTACVRVGVDKDRVDNREAHVLAKSRVIEALTRADTYRCPNNPPELQLCGNYHQVGGVERHPDMILEGWDLVFVFKRRAGHDLTPSALLATALHPHHLHSKFHCAPPALYTHGQQQPHKLTDCEERKFSTMAIAMRSNITVDFSTLDDELSDRALLSKEGALTPMECFMAGFHPSHFECMPLRLDDTFGDGGMDDRYLALGVAWRELALEEYAQDVGCLRHLSPEIVVEQLGILYEENGVTGTEAFNEFHPTVSMPYRRDLHHTFVIIDPETGDTELSGNKSRGDLREMTSDYKSRTGKYPAFDTRDRQRLLWMYCFDNFNIVACQRAGLLAGAFSPHQRDRLAGIHASANWMRLLDPRFYFYVGSFSQQAVHYRPLRLHIILSYFGQRIAFYFAFNQFLSVCLFWLCFAGLLSKAAGWLATFYDPSMSMDFKARIFFIFPSVLFGPLSLRYWVRFENALIHCWGFNVLSREEEQLCCHYEECIQIRADFDHSNTCLVLSPDPRKQIRRRICTSFCGALYLVLVFLAFLLFARRLQVTAPNSDESRWGAYMYQLLVFLARILWERTLAPWLATFEMHKYQYEWDDSVDQKRNIISGATSIFPFIMVMVSARRQGAHRTGLLDSLEHQLRVSMGMNILFILLDVLSPAAILKIQQYRFGSTTANDLGLQFLQPGYDGDGVSADFTQLIQPVVIMNLFGVVDPICSPFLMLAMVLINLYIDFGKIVHLYRRPPATKAKGLGVTRMWTLRFSIWLGFFSKACIFVFGIDWGDDGDPLTSPFASKFPGAGPISYACVACGLCVCMLFAEHLVLMIPDTQARTRVLEQRHQWQQQKLARRTMHDDDYTPPCPTLKELHDLLGTCDSGVCCSSRTTRSGTWQPL